jgi:hypothetical protein
MSVTALRIVTDRPEYSRFESGRSVIRARVIPTPATAPADTVTVNLCRFSGHVMKSVTLDFSAGNFPNGAVAEFDLKQIVDQFGLCTVISGDYYLEAVNAAETIRSAKCPARVSLITVEEMKSLYCMGLPMRSGDVLKPRKQPRVVTGVMIQNVSQGTVPGLYPLAFNKGAGSAANTLVWGDGGLTVELDQGITDEILVDQDGNYTEVLIDHFGLPASDVSESILIDEETLSDEAIRTQIAHAAKEIESRLGGTWLEPTRIATEPYFLDPAQGQQQEAFPYFDARGQEAAFYRSEVFTERAKTWHISFPYKWVQQVPYMCGFFGNTQSLTLNAVCKVNRIMGTVDFLPDNTTYSYILTFFAQLDMWGIRDYIASFWRYKAIVGLPEVDGDLLKVIGYTAAIPLLTTAGNAYRGGKSSESISKDGVSRSASYGQGPYGMAIKECNDWLKSNGSRVISRIKGFTQTIL